MGRLAPSSPTIHLWKEKRLPARGQGRRQGCSSALAPRTGCHTQFTSHPGTVALALHVGVSGQSPDLLLSLTTLRGAPPPPYVPVTKPTG